MLVSLARVRSRLALPASVPDETVTQLRDAVAAAVVPLLADDVDTSETGAPANIAELTLSVCRDVWLEGRQAYESGGDFGGFVAGVTSHMVQKRAVLLNPSRHPETLAR